MNRNTFNTYINEADFRGLFLMELGWNKPKGNHRLLPIVIDETEYRFICVAERNGLQVVVTDVENIPSTSLARRIDAQLRKQAQDYIAIYKSNDTNGHHAWVVPVKNVDKRDLVIIEYESPSKADFLLQKLDCITFDPTETTTIVDVKEGVHRAFAVNAEKITKDFYSGFKKEHTAFAKFISGIDDNIAVKENRNKQWYASVMLNRLMFCYFIQKKGFLDGNVNYLREKLEWMRREQGDNQFFGSFYKEFLTRLFADGLNAPQHDREFIAKFGRIPYLNGGMFDHHQIERDYANIDIADDAFISLFAFFDKWQWHLDTRVTASGRDINPDVLGYIFEQYINDRAAMGAYYTKEDIKDLVDYAGRLHIDVIPEIEFPGHSLSALVAFPELSCTGGPFESEQVFGYEENVFCIGNDSVFTLMEDILREVAAMFPSKYLHIGGDECVKNRWRECQRCQALANG